MNTAMSIMALTIALVLGLATALPSTPRSAVRLLRGGIAPMTFSEVDLDSDRNLTSLFQHNQAWAAQATDEDPEYFERVSKGQAPQILWIGCADARVDAKTILGLSKDEVFVTRNVANVVSPLDTSLMAVLEYAVLHLKVSHIVVCGHYDCGGVKASTTSVDFGGAIERWLGALRDNRFRHFDELESITDPAAKIRRLVELNVEEQCINVLKSGVVQQRRIETYCDVENQQFAKPRIHGLVYDPGTGKLRDLGVNFPTEGPGSIFNVQVDEKAKVAIAAAKVARQRLRALGLTTGANYHS